jgi:hypothetical protein
MSFVRRKRGQVLLVQNERVPGSSKVRQRELHRFSSPADLEQVLAPTAWKTWTESIAWREREIDFDWPALRERQHGEAEVAADLGRAQCRGRRGL